MERSKAISGEIVARHDPASRFGVNLRLQRRELLGAAPPVIRDLARFRLVSLRHVESRATPPPPVGLDAHAGTLAIAWGRL